MALYHTTRGPVDYTVVGSPTIMDGVASGFSASDYLVTGSALQSTDDFEMACTFTMPNDNLSNSLTSLFIGKYGSSARNGLDIYTPTPGTSYAHAYIRTMDNNDYGITVHAVALQKNHTYTSKLYYKNGIYSVELWENGTKISDGNIHKSTSLIVPTPIYIGKVADIGNAFPGSIDLNETYIKVNGQPWFGNCPVEVQKHQLRGPVGYEVVGSPTIMDGVASGFSLTNCIVTSSSLNNPDYFEEVCEFTMPNSWVGTNSIKPLILNGNNRGLDIYNPSSNEFYLHCYLRFTDNTEGGYWVPDVLLQAGQTYTGKLIRNNDTEYHLELWQNGSKIAEKVISETKKMLNNTSIKIGSNTSSSYFEGSIDLNQTYIKVNGKLWFYQPADTKYIVKDGKLVWADPRIYLQSSGTQYIDTNVVRDITKSFTLSGYFNFSETQTRQVMGAQGNAYFGVVSGHYQVGQPLNAYVQGTTAVENSFVPFNVTIDCQNSTIIYDIDTYSGSREQLINDSPQNAHFCLFSLNDGILPCSYKLKPTKMYENRTLIRDFVPVPTGLQIGNFTVPSNGMFDIVNQQFYANKGTGEFTIGRDE